MRKFMIVYILAVVMTAALLTGLAGCNRGAVTPADATATYGAEQFHLQLTAQAVEQP